MTIERDSSVARVAIENDATVEAAVAAMQTMEGVLQARKAAAYQFAIAHGRDTPEEARASFDAAIDEYVTNYLLKALASDAAFPRFITNFLPPRVRDGRNLPGSRMGGDNPDNVYRLAGIAHGGRYRVKGRARTPPVNASFTLTGNYGTSVTIATIENHQLQLEPDGSFVITIDDRPTDGRPNHLTTLPHVKFLFVRDTLADWSIEAPYELQIERLDDPGVKPLTVEEIARRAAFRLLEDVPLYFWFHRMFSGVPMNTVRPPNPSSALGGLVTQAGAHGWFRLEADEVAVLRLRAGGAAYAALELTDWWFRSIDAHRRPSSLTHAQAVSGTDGSIECVIAREDPGLANWLDTGGLSTVLLIGRWQGLPPVLTAGGPALHVDIMSRAELRSKRVVAGGAIDARERTRQLEARAAAWERRFQSAH